MVSNDVSKHGKVTLTAARVAGLKEIRDRAGCLAVVLSLDDDWSDFFPDFDWSLLEVR